MPSPAPLLIAYDAECDHCRRMMNWICTRDTGGLIVTFPFQNSELVRVAPELAGYPLDLELHGLDTMTRRVLVGAELLPRICLRLPRWRWVAPLMWIPGFSRVCFRKSWGLAMHRFHGAGRRTSPRR